MENIAEGNKIKLQTNEIVIPAKDRSAQNLFKENSPNSADSFPPQMRGMKGEPWHNRLIYGDNILVMSALLAGDEGNMLESMRGKIDLIYIDPPFDSKADYRTKITLP